MDPSHRFSSRSERIGIAILICSIMLMPFINVPASAASEKFALARLNSNGVLDTTFWGDGIHIRDLPGSTSESINDIALDSSGRVVAGGWATVGGTTVFALVRFTTGGTLDKTFSSDGIIFLNFNSSTSEQINAIAIDSNGRIVAVGDARINGERIMVLARFTSAGVLDTTCDLDGIKFMNVPSSALDSATSVAVTSSNIVIGGIAISTIESVGEIHAIYYRKASDCSLDTAFDSDGFKRKDFSGTFSDHISSIAIDSSGRIVAGGTSNSHDGPYDDSAVFSFARYNKNGALDTTCSFDGYKSFNIADRVTDVANALAVTSSKIVMAGYAASVQPVIAIVRFDASNCGTDKTFGSMGVVIHDIPAAYELIQDIRIDSSGRIVAAGNFSPDSSGGSLCRWFVSRYTSSGGLDNTFSGDAVKEINLPGELESASSIALTSSGKIYVGGTADKQGC